MQLYTKVKNFFSPQEMEGGTPALSHAESDITQSTPVPQTKLTVITGPPVARFNTQALDVMEQKVSHWKETKRLCSISFLKFMLRTDGYSEKHKNICEFVQLSEKTSHRTDHALAVLLKSVCHTWQQPMAFYFTEQAAAGRQMKAIIKTIVEAVCKTGLRPIALISNQDTSFQYAFRSLQRDTRKSQILAGEETDDTIHLNGQCLSVLYDPLHLLRGVRNHFLSKNVQMYGKTSRWQDLVEVYRVDHQDRDGSCHPRFLNELEDEDIIPEKIKKKKAENCVHVFSKTMAGVLKFTTSFQCHMNGSPVSTTLSNTAKLMSFFADLYDSVTVTPKHSRRRQTDKKLRTEVSSHTEHHAFWPKAIQTIENIKFIDKHGKLTTARSLTNWITTIKSFQRLWKLLQRLLIKKHVVFMYPGDFNLPAIENWKSIL